MQLPSQHGPEGGNIYSPVGRIMLNATDFHLENCISYAPFGAYFDSDKSSPDAITWVDYTKKAKTVSKHFHEK